jgi:alkanesulfonate monooxygenase SsuD/methylene tetrahydromethanopterin reductase-like flavin-dependent oxidoreductase (luciferase family)
MIVQLTRSDGLMNWKGKLTQSLSNISVYPKPVQHPIPTWIAVGGTPQSVMRGIKFISCLLRIFRDIAMLVDA